MTDGASDPSDSPQPSRAIWKKLTLLAVLVIIAVVAYFQFREQLQLENLAQHEGALRDFQKDRPVLVYGAAFFIYVAVTGLSLPGAAGLSLLYGWFFGMLRGLVLVSFASTTGATIAFLLSRYLVGSTVQQKFSTRLASFNRALEREGPFFLFTLRLIPLVPFFVINVVMGLTPIKTWSFWWISQLGMLPGTCAYIYAGSSVPDLQSLADQGVEAVFSARQLIQMGIAFALLGILPFLLRGLLYLIKKLLGREMEPMPTND